MHNLEFEQQAAGDHSLMAEELGLAIQAHKKAEQDLEQLQLMLAEEVELMLYCSSSQLCR